MNPNEKLIEVKDLCKHFEITKRFTRRKVGTVKAVNGANFSIRRGEILGLVGESGCGKTTTGRCIMRAIEPTSGEVNVDFSGTGPVNLLTMEKSELKKTRRAMRMVFQDPYSSLNPRMTVLQIVSEVLILNRITRNRKEIEERASNILERVGLDPEHMRRYPHAFSGGQRQRIAVARALISGPKFIVADEPVSALDVSIQAQILNLLKGLKKEFDLTLLFIAHNLAVVEHMCERIAVMYLGEIVELADRKELFYNPRNPYTEALLSAVPVPDPRIKKKRIPLKGDVADMLDLPSGCYFHPRCRYTQEICRKEKPPLTDLALPGQSEHLSACHFAKELELKGG